MNEPEYVTLDAEECDRLWAMLDAGEYWGGTGVVRSLVRTIRTLRAENERLETALAGLADCMERVIAAYAAFDDAMPVTATGYLIAARAVLAGEHWAGEGA